MSQVALHLYRKLHEARNDEARSDAIVEAFSELEERFPGLKDTATRQHLSETELRLQKEIEGIRLEIKQVEGNLRKEIEQVRLEIKQVEASLRKEIEQVRLEIEKTRTDMKRIELEMARAMHRQTLWVVGSIGTLITAIRLLDWFLAHGTH
jgi:multidrug resistance efflux pump